MYFGTFPLRKWQRPFPVSALAIALTIPFSAPGAMGSELAETQVLQRIAFGSCAHQQKPQPIWNAIRASKPDVFLFLGDNIYGDTEDMAVLRAKYQKLDAIPEFAALRSSCPVLGIWDDHDYGVNDGGAEYPMRAEAQEAFADFFRLPADSPVRSRPGIYDSRVIGPEGRRVQIIQLDCRYFRSPLVKLSQRGAHGPYAPNRDPAATVLGEAQWKWLEEQWKVPADLRVVMSSTQVLVQDHAWECWENFPLERARLLGQLKESGAGRVIFLSGDRHLAEIMCLSNEDPLSPGFPVWEVTSSSLTNPGGGRDNEPNRHRISEGNFRDVNFGILEIDWKSGQVVASIRNLEGKPVFSHRIPLGSLDPPN